MTAEQIRAALQAAILESARLVRLPPTAVRRARLKQLDREKARLAQKARLARLYRDKATSGA